jgi:hypothetical protein
MLDGERRMALFLLTMLGMFGSQDERWKCIMRSSQEGRGCSMS